MFTTFQISKFDIIFLQETHNYSYLNSGKVEWLGPNFWNPGSNLSCGVGILFRKDFPFTIHKVVSDSQGRTLSIDCCIQGEDCRLINIYCPNNKNKNDLVNYLQSLEKYLNTSRTVVLGGDFNFIEDSKFDRFSTGPDIRVQSQTASKTFNSLASRQLLVDSYKFKNPSQKAYTFYNSTYQSYKRLDRIYISKRIKDSIREVTHLTINKTDHKAVNCNILLGNNPKGKGFWKANINTFNDPFFKEDFHALWANVNKFEDKAYSGPWWESCKKKFKKLIMNHSCRLAENKKAIANSLYSSLNKWDSDLLNNKSPDPQIKSNLEIELNALINESVEGNRIRSKALHLDSTDKPVKYFLKTENLRASSKFIVKLDDDNVTKTSKIEIQNSVYKFYNSLLNAPATDLKELPQFLEGLPTLSRDLSDSCEGPITGEEVWLALKDMKNNKSPGPDGLPAEFYKSFFPIIGPTFVKLLNNLIDSNDVLTESQRLSYITLLCKDKNKAEDLSSWRPISLLNTDYKILSKVILNRIKKVAGEIIHPNQTCAIPGRNLNDNLHLLRNVTDYSNDHNFNLFLVTFDQSKAFDRVDHQFMFSLLRRFGFGSNVIKIIKLMYTDIHSQVLVNGFLTRKIKITRSMRQGCNLSPLLYAMCIETLANRVRSLTLYKGIQIPGSIDQIKIILHADDTSLFAADIFSVNMALQIFDKYSQLSGAVVNKSKCKACVLSGNPSTSNWPSWIAMENSVKICGVFYGGNAKALNEERILSKLNNIISFYKSLQFKLTLRGKVTILNTVILNKIWFIGNIVTLSNTFLKKLNKIIFSFLWRTTEWIKRTTVVNTVENGGLGLIHIKTRLNTFYVKHLLSIIENPYSYYASFAIYWLGITRDTISLVYLLLDTLTL
jgi:exonuclease III